MKLARVVLSSLAVYLIAASVLGTAFAASQGFAAYGLTVTSHGASRSLTINESVAAGKNPSFDILTLSAMSAAWNLSYSRQVNSSLQLFPFLPALPSQNFSFAYGSSEVSARVVQNGTVAVEFQGSGHELTSYTFKAHLSSANLTGAMTGSYTTFPSGLLYSLRAQINGTSSVALVLEATSLPLSTGSSSSALQTASVGLGVGAVGSVLALSLGVRSRHGHKQQPANKPDYWVD